MWKRIYIYIYVQLNPFAVHQKLTQHCNSTILHLKKKNNIKKNGNRTVTECVGRNKNPE